MLHMPLMPKSTIVGFCFGRKGGAEQGFQFRNLKTHLSCLMRCRLTTRVTHIFVLPSVACLSYVTGEVCCPFSAPPSAFYPPLALVPPFTGSSFRHCTHYSVDFMNMVHLHLLCAHSGFVLMLWLSVLTLCRTIRGKPKYFKGVIDLTYVKYSE